MSQNIEKQAENFRQSRKNIEDALEACQKIIDRQMKIIYESPFDSAEYNEALEVRSRFIARRSVMLWVVGEQDDWI